MSDRNSTKPLLITGMHRSGTSMATRLLNLCGLHLGDPRRLLKAQADNPQGFWENLDFVTLDDRILARMDGAWDLPPANPAADPALLEEFRAAATDCAAAASAGAPESAAAGAWGWKDPRCSLLLPFWASVLPGLKVVICLRDPAEVAASLSRRNGFSARLGLHLWQRYNERLEQDLRADPGIESVVTHYEALLACPEQELRRLTDWLGWPVADEAIAEACASVKPELRHHRQGLERLQGVGGPEGPASLYDKLCQRAGPNYSELHTADSREAVLTTPPSFSNPTWTEIPRRGIFPVS